MTVAARVDHAADAAKVVQQLRLRKLLIFGNPTAGTPLMQSRQPVGIDLPMQALAWADSDGQAWPHDNDPEYLVRRPDISDRDALAEKMRKMLGDLSAAATGASGQPSAQVQ